MKVLVFAKGTEITVATRTRTAANALARRATNVHPAAAALVPASWDGRGKPPLGYTVPSAELTEPGGARVAIVVEDAFASGRGDFATALSQLPGDWAKNVDTAGVKGAGG